MDKASKMKSDPWNHNQNIEHNNELDNMVPADLGRIDHQFLLIPKFLNCEEIY